MVFLVGQYTPKSEKVPQHPTFAELEYINEWNNSPQAFGFLFNHGISTRCCYNCKCGTHQELMLWIFYLRVTVPSWYFIKPLNKFWLSFFLKNALIFSDHCHCQHILELRTEWYKHLPVVGSFHEMHWILLGDWV